MAVDRDNIKWGAGSLEVQRIVPTVGTRFDVGACKEFEIVYTKEFVAVECGQQMGIVLLGAVADACEVNITLQEENSNNLRFIFTDNATGGAPSTVIPIGGVKTIYQYKLIYTPINPPLHALGTVTVHKAVVAPPTRIKFSKKSARDFTINLKCIPVGGQYAEYGYEDV